MDGKLHRFIKYWIKCTFFITFNTEFSLPSQSYWAVCRTLPNQSPCDLCSTSPWGGVLCGAFGPLLQTTQSLCNQTESLVYTMGRLVPSQSWTSSLYHVLKIFCVELSDLVTSGDLALLALSSCTLPPGQNAHSWLGMKCFPSLAGLFFFFQIMGKCMGTSLLL